MYTFEREFAYILRFTPHLKEGAQGSIEHEVMTPMHYNIFAANKICSGLEWLVKNTGTAIPRNAIVNLLMSSILRTRISR